MTEFKDLDAESLEELEQDLRKLLDIPPAALAELLPLIKSDRGISVPRANRERVTKLAKTVGLSDDEIRDVIAVLSFLLDLSSEPGATVSDDLDELRRFLADRGIRGFESHADILEQYMTPSDRLRRLQRLRTYAS